MYPAKISMNSDPHSKEAELKRREAQLRERELQIRMRELEAELSDATPVQPTVIHSESPRRLKKPWYKKLPDVAKFFLMVVTVFVAIRVAAWLATAVIVLSLGWVGYKFFLEGDRD